MKRRLFFDMDGSLVDFISGVSKVDKAIVVQYEEHFDDIPGVFALMELMLGSVLSRFQM